MSATAIARIIGALAVSAALAAAPGVARADPARAAIPVRAATASAPQAPDGPAVGAGAEALPNLRTKSWVLADLDSGAILASFHPDDQRRPASTLKLLTVLTVLPRLSPDQPYRAVKADETAEGNRVVLYQGLKYKLSDLVHAALMPSANDAANALARANGGLERTVGLMATEAARLGATSTTVRNPSGLDADGQLTTARDLAVIGRAALQNPEIAAYLKIDKVDFPGRREAGHRFMYPIYTHNRMLIDGFDGALGGKSGYTSLARRTFVGGAQRDGHRLVVAMMGIGSNQYRTPERLLNWGFANYSRITAPVGQLPEPSSPAPEFDRSIRPLPPKGEIPSVALLSQSGDAPTAPFGPFRLHLPYIPGMPSPLRLLTICIAVMGALRVRLLWIEHRHRTGWTTLDQWRVAEVASPPSAAVDLTLGLAEAVPAGSFGGSHTPGETPPAPHPHGLGKSVQVAALD